MTRLLALLYWQAWGVILMTLEALVEAIRWRMGKR